MNTWLSQSLEIIRNNMKMLRSGCTHKKILFTLCYFWIILEPTFSSLINVANTKNLPIKSATEWYFMQVCYYFIHKYYTRIKMFSMDKSSNLICGSSNIDKWSQNCKKTDNKHLMITIIRNNMKVLRKNVSYLKTKFSFSHC